MPCQAQSKLKRQSSLFFGFSKGLLPIFFIFFQLPGSEVSADPTCAVQTYSWLTLRRTCITFRTFMSTPVTSPRTPPNLKLERVSGGVYPRSPNVSVNKNVEWINARGAWTFYIALILLNWVVLSTFLTPGYAWTYVHLIHGVVTYYLLHWHKGSPIDMDQGKYDKLTFWEQLDDGVQNTNNRKFFTAVPVVLFLLAAHGSDYRRQPLGVNLVVVLVLVIAKFSSMHKVRIFGIGEVKYNA